MHDQKFWDWWTFLTFYYMYRKLSLKLEMNYASNFTGTSELFEDLFEMVDVVTGFSNSVETSGVSVLWKPVSSLVAGNWSISEL